MEMDLKKCGRAWETAGFLGWDEGGGALTKSYHFPSNPLPPLLPYSGELPECKFRFSVNVKILESGLV